MPSHEPEALPVIEALHSTPSRRFLSAEPIPEDVIRALLDAAVRGPSGGNSQLWAWIVVRDPQVKAQIAQWYREGWNATYASRAGVPKDAVFRASDHLAEHLEEAPV